MTDKEVMPLILTNKYGDEWYLTGCQHQYRLGDAYAEGTVAQRDADLKVFEAEKQRLHNRYGEIIASKDVEIREWREKEAEEWETLLQHLVLLPETPEIKSIIRAVNKHITKLRKGDD